MKRFAAVVAAVLFIAVAGISSAGADPLLQQDFVHELMMDSPDAPVKVLFGRHAAIYLLDRGDPDFAARLAILQRSRDQGTPVRFAYDVYGPTLTLVEAVQ